MNISIRKRPGFLKRLILCAIVILGQVLISDCDTKPEGKANPDNTQTPAKEIIEAYDNYKNAVSNADGQKAAGLVAGKTIQYYNALIGLVLEADSGKLILTGPLEKFTVLAIRQTVDWKILRTMEGKDLFAYAIANGMIGKGISKTTIGNIELKNDALARAELLIEGKQTNKFTYFYREEGRWRVDLMEQFKENELSLRKTIYQPNLSETQCLVLFYKKTFGVNPGKEIWLPVKWFEK